MTKRDDGGPAFPQIEELWEPAVNSPVPGATKFATYFPQGGMSLRDWFAGQVLPAVMHSFNTHMPEDASLSNIATESYWVADAMLEARAEPVVYKQEFDG